MKVTVKMLMEDIESGFYLPIDETTMLNGVDASGLCGQMRFRTSDDTCSVVFNNVSEDSAKDIGLYHASLDQDLC